MSYLLLIVPLCCATHCGSLQIPCTDDAVLPYPTEHAQTMVGMWDVCSPTFEPVASSQETGQKQPCSSELEESNDTDPPTSLMRRFIRWVWPDLYLIFLFSLWYLLCNKGKCNTNNGIAIFGWLEYNLTEFIQCAAALYKMMIELGKCTMAIYIIQFFTMHVH